MTHVLALLLALGSTASADPRAPHGPLEAREQWLLAMPVPNLPGVGTDTLARGSTEVRVEADWGNDFGWKPSPTDVGPRPKADEKIFFLVDGEHRTVAVRVRRGLGGGWDGAVRLGVRWRGPGVLDTVIDPFHDLFGFPNAGRPFFPQNMLRVEGDMAGGGRLAWEGRAGTGLAAPEVELRRSFRNADARLRPALVLRAALPVGTGSVGGGGVQAVLSARLTRVFHAHGGLGLVVLAAEEAEGVPYQRTRTHGFGALEWRFADRWGLVAQGEMASRLVGEQLAGHPALHLYLRTGMRWDVGTAWRLEGSFVEGLAALDGTTDFGVMFAAQRRF